MAHEQPDINQISDPKMREFFLRGMVYIRQMQSQRAIKNTDPEFVAWGEYFERVIGEFPVAYRMAARDPNRAFTVPAQWPQWFEASYALPAPQREAAE